MSGREVTDTRWPIAPRRVAPRPERRTTHSTLRLGPRCSPAELRRYPFEGVQPYADNAMMLANHFPLLGLRLEAADLQLRLPSPDDLAVLADLAADGVHEPGTMPFSVPWTDQSPVERARSVVVHHWALLGRWTPASWTLPLVVSHNGTVVGRQCLSATDFAVTTECSTASWLGLRYQGNGVGTQMRAAVAHLAFACLGASDLRSAAFLDNAASLRVSAKLGYVPDGVSRHAVQGRLRVAQRLRLTRDAWQQSPRPAVTVHGLQACLPLFGLAEPVPA